MCKGAVLSHTPPCLLATAAGAAAAWAFTPARVKTAQAGLPPCQANQSRPRDSPPGRAMTRRPRAAALLAITLAAAFTAAVTAQDCDPTGEGLVGCCPGTRQYEGEGRTGGPWMAARGWAGALAPSARPAPTPSRHPSPLSECECGGCVTETQGCFYAGIVATQAGGRAGREGGCAKGARAGRGDRWEGRARGPDVGRDPPCLPHFSQGYCYGHPGGSLPPPPPPKDAATPAPTDAATPTPTDAATPAPTDTVKAAPTDAAMPEATPLETMEAATPSPTAVATPAPTPPETTAPAATPRPGTPVAAASTTPDPSPPTDTPAPAADQCDPNGTGATGCCPGTPQYDVCECWGCLEPSGECQYAVLVGTQAREA